MPELPPDRRSERARATSLVSLILLVILIGVLIGWAWHRNPPATPSVAGTAAPASAPAGAGG
jgi:hypothetical protein